MEQEGQKGQGAFTPGPWSVSKRKGRRVTNAHGVVICNAVLRNSGTSKGGIKHGAKDVLEAEANALLIAAGPELLEALVAFLAEADGGHVTVETDRKARAAILKATRGSL